MLFYIKFILSSLPTLIKESNIPTDKLLHFFAGMSIFILSVPVAMMLGFTPIIFGSVMTFTAAIGKELFDYCSNTINIRHNKQPTHSVDFMDFVATLLGAVPAIIFLLG